MKTQENQNQKKVILLLTIILIDVQTVAFSQEYLDDEHRIMKLTEVSTDSTYGYSILNPVKIGEKKKANIAYLEALKCPNGGQISLKDVNFNVDGQGGLQLFVLSLEGTSETRRLYLDLREYDAPKAPVGFLFKTEDDIPYVEVYPEDSIVKGDRCYDDLYYVYNFAIRDRIEGLSQPDYPPTYIDGEEVLKQYFVSHSLTDERGKNRIFRSAIAFVVNCEGEAGNFEIVTKGIGDLATLSNQVLAIVNKMPQRWQPAIKDGQAVDCWVVVSFRVHLGQLIYEGLPRIKVEESR